MKVQLVKSNKDSYIDHIKKSGLGDILHKYEAHKNFLENWDLSVLNLKDMFDQSFKSKISGRLWDGSKNSAKSMMLIFMNDYKEFIRSIFRDLEDEKKDVAMRINRFLLHCDELLIQMQKSGKKINDHYHTNKIVALYLTFIYPDRYTIFDYDQFNISMQKFQARQSIQAFEISKFFILSRSLFKILSADEELITIYTTLLSKEGLNFKDSQMLIVSDFYEFVGGGK